MYQFNPTPRNETQGRGLWRFFLPGQDKAGTDAELAANGYSAELDKKPETWKPILDAARQGNVILLYSTRETEHNNAVALKMYLEKA